MAARIPMIATTIISSISVKPCCFFMDSPWGWVPHCCKCAALYATVMPRVECVRGIPGIPSKTLPEQYLAECLQGMDQGLKAPGRWPAGVGGATPGATTPQVTRRVTLETLGNN